MKEIMFVIIVSLTKNTLINNNILIYAFDLTGLSAKE
jgi:hypothetical protein